MKKTINITIEQARELYKINPHLRNTVLSPFSDAELGIKPKIKTWEELEKFSGYFIANESSIKKIGRQNTIPCNKNICATIAQAKSILAFCQLTQLLEDLREYTDVNWSDIYTAKYCIISKIDDETKEISPIVDEEFRHPRFLAFNDKDIAKEFLKVNRGLIMKYFKKYE